MLLNSRVDITRARAKFQAIVPIARRTGRDVLTQEGRLVAISLAKSSQPFGTGEASLKKGRDRTAGDIHKVYATPGRAYADIANEKQAKAFWWAIKNGKAGKAWGILRKDGRTLRSAGIGSFENGSLHELNRDPNTGRVRLKTPLIVVTNPRQLSVYVRKKQSHVGFGKSAWSGIARQLGSIRGLRTTGDITANWITRQAGPGHIAWSGTDESPILTMTSTVRYASQILPDHMKRAAVSIARDRLAKSLLTAMRAEMRNARLAA
jgi:hypothetical protein